MEQGGPAAVGGRGARVRLCIAKSAWGLPAMSPEDLAPQALLRFAGCEVEIVEGASPEASPTRQLPYLEVEGGKVVGHPHIIPFLCNEFDQTKRLQSVLPDGYVVDSQAYIAMTNSQLNHARLFCWWCEKPNYDQVVRRKHGDLFAFPVGRYLTWRRQWAVSSSLPALGLGGADDAYALADECYAVLEHRLGDGPLFHGETLSALDAVVFGHVCVHLAVPLPVDALRARLTAHPRLVAFCRRVLESHFPELVDGNTELRRNLDAPTGPRDHTEYSAQRTSNAPGGIADLQADPASSTVPLPVPSSVMLHPTSLAAHAYDRAKQGARGASRETRHALGRCAPASPASPTTHGPPTAWNGGTKVFVGFAAVSVVGFVLLFDFRPR